MEVSARDYMKDSLVQLDEMSDFLVKKLKSVRKIHQRIELFNQINKYLIYIGFFSTQQSLVSEEEQVIIRPVLLIDTITEVKQKKNLLRDRLIFKIKEVNKPLSGSQHASAFVMFCNFSHPDLSDRWTTFFNKNIGVTQPRKRARIDVEEAGGQPIIGVAVIEGLYDRDEEWEIPTQKIEIYGKPLEQDYMFQEEEEEIVGTGRIFEGTTGSIAQDGEGKPPEECEKKDDGFFLSPYESQFKGVIKKINLTDRGIIGFSSKFTKVENQLFLARLNNSSWEALDYYSVDDGSVVTYDYDTLNGRIATCYKYDEKEHIQLFGCHFDGHPLNNNYLRYTLDLGTELSPCVAVKTIGKHTVSAHWDGGINIFDLENAIETQIGKSVPRSHLRGHTKPIYSLDGIQRDKITEIYTGASDRWIKVSTIHHDTRQYEERILKGHTKTISALHVSQDNLFSMDVKEMKIWNLATGKADSLDISDLFLDNKDPHPDCGLFSVENEVFVLGPKGIVSFKNNNRTSINIQREGCIATAFTIHRNLLIMGSHDNKSGYISSYDFRHLRAPVQEVSVK